MPVSRPPPPFYVLLAHSPLSNVPSGALSNTLAHPTVQYHYADDSPLSILPTHPQESVLILNYDPISTQPTVQSVSDVLITTGLRFEEAPGAAADDSKVERNTSMFIIETTTNDQYVDLRTVLLHPLIYPSFSLMVASHPDRRALQATLAQFKHRSNFVVHNPQIVMLTIQQE